MKKNILLKFLVITIFFIILNSIPAYAVNYDKVSTGGTATASSKYSSSYSAAKSFDSSASIYWCLASLSSPTTPAWLRYQLSSARVVNSKNKQGQTLKLDKFDGQ
jgi:hypothetical protein